MQVKDIMIPVVESVRPDATLREANEKMRSLDIDPMPVAEDGKIVGMLTARAIADRAAHDGLATGSVKVSEAMESQLVCCTSDQSLEDALQHVAKHRDEISTSRLPVTDGQNHLVGIVSVADIRARTENPPGEVDAAEAVNAVDQLVDFDEDRVDYMSDSSFPASDPIPPPTALGREEQDPNG